MTLQDLNALATFFLKHRFCVKIIDFDITTGALYLKKEFFFKLVTFEKKGVGLGQLL